MKMSQEQLEEREFEWRRTRFGGITQYIVFHPITGLVRAVQYLRSKTGNHGTDIYLLPKEEWKEVWVIGLFQSNTGKRSCTFSKNVSEWIRDGVKLVWMLEFSDVEKVIMWLERQR